jgi:hypothetical protein
MYADNQYKWVVVISRKAPIPTLVNAATHLALNLPAQCGDSAAAHFHNYEGSDGNVISSISHWPVIILQAENSNQLRTLRIAAQAAGVPCQAFVDTMLGPSAAEQLRRTQATSDSDLNYLAVALFGDASVLRALTKKFSLFAERPEETQPRAFHCLDPH